MIGTRVLVGSLLGLAAVGVLVGDGYLRPWFPGLFACLIALGVLAGRELVRLFPASYRPSEPLVLAGVLLCVAANWYPTVRAEFGSAPMPEAPAAALAFAAVLAVFAATLVAAFLLE